MLNNTFITVTPGAIKDIVDLIPAGPNARADAEPLVQITILHAQQFAETFSMYPFLEAEPIHAFIGFTLNDPETNKSGMRKAFSLRMVADGLEIGSLREAQPDDEYEIRKVLTECRLPEYNDAQSPLEPFKR